MEPLQCVVISVVVLWIGYSIGMVKAYLNYNKVMREAAKSKLQRMEADITGKKLDEEIKKSLKK